jgi:hypothetical protein
MTMSFSFIQNALLNLPGIEHNLSLSSTHLTKNFVAPAILTTFPTISPGFGIFSELSGAVPLLWSKFPLFRLFIQNT